MDSLNGLTCVPMADPNVSTLDPMCMDPVGFQWLTMLLNKEAKPPTTGPGIIYMAQGAHGWVKDGTLIAKQEPESHAGSFPGSLDDFLAVRLEDERVPGLHQGPGKCCTG